MADAQILKNIELNILAFQLGSLKQNTLNLFNILGYESPHKMDIFENTPEGFLEYLKDNSRAINLNQAYFSEWKSVDFCLQLTNEESSLFENQVNNFDSIINSYLLFCIELNNKIYTNRALADITRAMNRVFPKPVFVLFKHGNSLTLSIINRRKHKKDSSKEVLEKITLIKDINISEPHRAHKEILFDLSLFELRSHNTINNFDDLHSAWQSVLNISELNKKFYREISNWYFWARENVEFPNKPLKLKKENETEYHERLLSFNSMNLIRLITRLIFVWFLKEKGLIPDILFSEKKIKDLLLFNDSKKSTYYKAILQNLFFATLNQEMNTTQKPDNRKFRHEKQHYNITNLYRYKSLFQDDKKALSLFEGIPFLNGGLFECLDKRVKNSSGEEETIRIDGFSDRTDNPLKVPDELFFSEQFNIDLSKVYESKNKNDKVRGIINILNNYKFTIAENTPVEEEVALDPELLGKVFENLLASYNPETGTTARKQTGSFYTPREIVNYMVDESLIAYIDTRLKDKKITTVDEAKLRILLSYSEEIPAFSNEEADAILEALDSAKILDPACGSGAFPMGILHKMVHIIHKLDPNNEKWKKRQIENQTKEIKQDIDHAERIKDDIAREKALAELNEKLKNINDIFDNNELDYGRKLFLIENCIYGIDIQPIAVQIAKLRFFISLIVEQKVNRAKYNSGIIPLPNLETKFVAANSLIGIEKPELSLFRFEIDKKEKELEAIRQKYFTARTPATKLKYRDEDEKKRKEIEVIFEDAGMKAEKASQLAKWNPYDQNASAGWFDTEWMYGIKDGFDIVLGNPPYIFTRDAEFTDEFKDYIAKTYFSLFKSKDKKSKTNQSGKINLFALFIMRGLFELKENRILTYIVPNNLLRTTTYDLVRKYLLENSKVDELVDLGSSIFDNVTASTIIFRISRGTNNSNHKTKIITEIKDLEKQDFIESEILQSQFLKNVSYTFNLFADLDTNDLLNKISVNKKYLGEFCIDIIEGIVAHKHLIVDFKVKNSYPMLEGKTIKKYGLHPVKKYIIWKKDEIHRTRPDYLWEAPKKIIIQRISGGSNPLKATIDCSKYKTFASINNLLLKDTYKNMYEYIVALINSRVLNWFYANSFSNNSELTVNISKTYLEKLPISVINDKEQIAIKSIVKEIISTKETNPEKETKDIENLLDIIIFKIYGLNFDEVKIIEPDFSMSQAEYENFEVEG
jgi:hypothetical protein